METAVSWLVSQLNKQGFAQVVTDEEIKQAKAMEKQQIIDAYETSHISMMTSEQYYNETFKSTFPISDNEYKKVIKALYPKDNSRTFKSE